MTDLERLVAIEDIRRLQSRYVGHADLKEWHELAQLFMPNGTFVVRGPDGDLQETMIGRDAIERSVTQAVGAGRALHRLYSFEIDVDSPSRARGVFAMEDWIDRHVIEAAPGSGAAPRGSAGPSFKAMHGRGHYHVAYDGSDGRWLIESLELRRTTLEFTY